MASSSVYEEEDMEFEDARKPRHLKRKISNKEEKGREDVESDLDEKIKVMKGGEEAEKSTAEQIKELSRMEMAFKKKMDVEIEAKLRKQAEAELRKEKEARQQNIENRERKEKETRKQVEEETVQDITRKIQEKLKGMTEAVDRESNGKISVTKADQTTVRKNALGIQAELINILARLVTAEERTRKAVERARKAEEELKKWKGMGEGKDARREYERRRLQSRGVVTSEESDDSLKEQQSRARRGTYAQVSSKNVKGAHGERIERRVVVVGDEGWVMPPSRSKGEQKALIVTSSTEKDARKLADSLAKSVTVKEMGGTPQAVRVIKDGKLIMVPKDGEQKGKIIAALNKVEGVEIREGRRPEPLLMISGVAKGTTDEELVGQIGNELKDVVNVGKDGIKILRRITCRNPWKENLIIKTNMDTFKFLVKKGKVEIDCTFHFVEEYLGMAMCYRCCRFGHTSRICKEAEVCHRCGGGHDGRDCKETVLNCVNCRKMFNKGKGHSARDSGCPAMRQILAKSRGNISYGH